MSLAVARRAPAIGGKQLGQLMQALRTHAGITVDSTPGVVACHVRERMEHLGLCDIDAYLALLDDSIAARAERLALTDLMTVKETRFFRQPTAFQVLSQYFEQSTRDGADPNNIRSISEQRYHHATDTVIQLQNNIPFLMLLTEQALIPGDHPKCLVTCFGQLPRRTGIGAAYIFCTGIKETLKGSSTMVVTAQAIKRGDPEIAIPLFNNVVGDFVANRRWIIWHRSVLLEHTSVIY